MENTIFVKPVEGRRCKDPVTCELIPETGKNVPKSAYWLKRLAQGDCVEAEKANKKAGKKAEAKAEEKPAETKAESKSEEKAPKTSVKKGRK